MKKSLFLVLFLFSAFATASIRIDNDRSDCVRGWVSMDVDVYVNDEKFYFDPSCRFSFDKSFTTSKGERCEIHAGMCSVFAPRNRIEVKCERSGSDFVNVECPPENQ